MNKEVEKAESRVLDEACQWYNDTNKYGCMQDTEALYIAISDYVKAIKENL